MGKQSGTQPSPGNYGEQPQNDFGRRLGFQGVPMQGMPPAAAQMPQMGAQTPVQMVPPRPVQMPQQAAPMPNPQNYNDYLANVRASRAAPAAPAAAPTPAPAAAVTPDARQLVTDALRQRQRTFHTGNR